jgi:hypothetical protein
LELLYLFMSERSANRQAIERGIAGHRVAAIAGAAVLLLSALFSAPAAAQSLPAEFLGKFRGSITGTAAEEGDFDMVASNVRGGFAMTWSPGGKANFEASDRKNVFHAEDAGRPFEGEPTYWARLEEGTLYVYSMHIDTHGGYDIYTYMYKPADNGLDLTIRQLRSGAETMESVARLERHGG